MWCGWGGRVGAFRTRVGILDRVPSSYDTAGSTGGLKPSLDETLVAGRLPAAAAEEMPRSCSCKLSVIDFDLAVDDGVVHPFGQLRGIGVGAAGDDFRGIENRNVREIAGCEEAAVQPMLALRVTRSDLG